MIIFFFVTAFLIFSYHWLRNGFPVGSSAYGTTSARLIWAASFTLGYVFLAAPAVNIPLVALLFILQFIAMLIPHAAYQNMGRWPSPQKDWPAFWMPTLTQAQWDGMSSCARTTYDFFGMLSVGVFRGVIVYGLSSAALYGAGLFLPSVGGPILLAAAAAAIAAVSQPVAYLVGKFVPFGIWGTPAYSAGWGEIGVAAGWSASLAALVGVMKILHNLV